MYTLLINDNNEVITSVYETIMQRSTLVDNLQILVSKFYKGQLDMADSVAWMKYVLPSGDMKMIQLTLADDNYKDYNYLKYILPFNTKITAQHGIVSLSFTFIKTGDENTVYVRKTQEGRLEITPIAKWEGYVADDLLEPIDQRLIMLEARQQDLSSLHQEMFENMVNDVRLDSEGKRIRLTNVNGDVGNGVDVDDLSKIVSEYIVGVDADGIPDGVTYLDELTKNNMKFVNLDTMIKK